jgi:NADH:ubiquinone oxidoreductase subunit 6 (subunit J)
VDSAPSDNGPKLMRDESDVGSAKGEPSGSTVALSRVLFSKFVFAFEAVSVLLLVAIVGSVALAKSKGGTHHVA